jgi:hypothetical protein
VKCIKQDSGIICLSEDRRGEAIVGKRVWRWSFDSRFGPLWLRRDGEPLKDQDPVQAVWDAFQAWFDDTFPWDGSRHCCSIECDAAARWEIQARSGDLDANTDACDAHVAECSRAVDCGDGLDLHEIQP